MRQSIGAVCCLAAIVGTALVGCADPAADKPQAVVQDSQASAGPAADGDRYVITEESSVGFVGSKVTGSHDGGFHAVDGEIVVVDGNPTRSSVRVVIDTTSIWSDNERLTGHLKSDDFFEVETYPTATFDSTSIEPSGDGYTVTGNLDLHGVNKSISFPATITLEDGRVAARAEFAIKRLDWNIVYKGKADDLIRDDVVIKFDLIAVPGA